MKNEHEELSAKYLSQIERCFGKDISEKSICRYNRGWYLVGVAIRYPDGSIGGAQRRAMSVRRKELEKMIDRLESY